MESGREPAVAVDDADVAALEWAFARGEEGALRRLYDRYGRLVYSIALRRLDPEAAADITQEVFVSAWRAHDRYDPDRGAVAGWLVAITRNKIIDELRRRRRRVDTVSDEGVEVVELGADIATIADRMLVAEALKSLDARRRGLVELSFFEGLTHSAIAERTGTPLGTVKSEIRRGLERMRRYLDGRDE